jgi:hypothetical protein
VVHYTGAQLFLDLKESVPEDFEAFVEHVITKDSLKVRMRKWRRRREGRREEGRGGRRKKGGRFTFLNYSRAS